MKAKKPEIGDLRVWWKPQIPMNESFFVPVSSVVEGVKIMNVLADYDLFQLKNNIKPDYSNIGGLERFESDNGDGVPGWCSWIDEETGEDNPEAFLRNGS